MKEMPRRRMDVPKGCGKRDGDGHLFWECSPLPILHVREFVSIMSLDRSKWLRCLSWHGWLLGLSGARVGDPLAASFGQLERSLGAYLVDGSGFWTPPDYWDDDDLALELTDAPNTWTGGRREDFSSVGGFEVAGAGVFLLASELAFESAVWGVAEEYGDARLERCRVFMPVPGPLQTVQRAEYVGCHCCMTGVLALSFGY